MASGCHDHVWYISSIGPFSFHDPLACNSLATFSQRKIWCPDAGWAYAGFPVLLIYQLVDRSRPRATNFELVTSVFDTFGTGSLVAEPHGSSDLNSFPSGHSATAAALATVLIWKYPQARFFFLIVAISACLQRIFSMAHYPSDVCIGAACGILGAALVLGQDTANIPA